MAQSLPLFLAFLAVLCFPSSNLQWFDGLPFSRLPEFGALAVACAFVIFPGLRQEQANAWARWKIRPHYLWIVIGALFMLKIALWLSGAHAGFAGCYRSPAEPANITHETLPPRECERSYENIFDGFSATRLDESVWFDADNWNLVFLNTGRYNYYDWEEGNIPRSRIPVAARWEGVPDIPPGVPIRIEYVGQGTVVWGDSRADLPPAYAAPNVVDIEPPPSESALRIEFLFDDGSRSGQAPQSWGPRASIKVSSGRDADSPLQAQVTADALVRIPAVVADGLILLFIGSCLLAVGNSVRRDGIVLAGLVVGAGMISYLPMAPVFRVIGISCVLAACLMVHLAGRPFRAVTAYWLALAAGFAVFRILNSGYDHVLLRSAGNDPLSYESQAYSILATGSLRGGESVFEYVPAYRYIKFFEHAVFGDGDMLYASVQLAAFFGGVFALFRGAEGRPLSAVRKGALCFFGCGMIFLGGYYVSAVVREGLSEYDTWILLLWTLSGLYGAIRPAAVLAGAAALSLSYAIRPNQAIGILWIFFLTGVRSWKKHARTILTAVALALGIALLPLAHNIYFGGRWVPSATSGGMAVNLVLLPSTWSAFIRGDPVAAETVREQLGMVFLLTEAPRSMLPTLAVMAGFFFGWLAVGIREVARRNRSDLPWLATPLFFLAVHLLYGVSTYYPRHIVISYLAMAAVAVLILARNGSAAPTGDAPSSAVESH